MSPFLTPIDFQPEQIALRESKKNEEHKIMDLLGRFTARMLVDGLRRNLGHPEPEWGDEGSWRHYFIKECQRRGVGLLKGLDWPSCPQARYSNIHTNDVEALIDIATDWSGKTDDPIADQAWCIVEHWEPLQAHNSGGD